MKIIKLSELTKDVYAQKLAKKVGVDADQLRQGIDVEREHAGTLGTADMKVLAKIAIDHLREKPDYYTGLKKMEKETGNIRTEKELPPNLAMARDWDKEAYARKAWEKRKAELNQQNRDLAAEWEKKNDAEKADFLAKRNKPRTESSPNRGKDIAQWEKRKKEWQQDRPKPNEKDMDSYLDTDDVRTEDIDTTQGRKQTCKWCGKDTHKTGGYCSNMCRRDAEEDKMSVNPDLDENKFFQPCPQCGRDTVDGGFCSSTCRSNYKEENPELDEVSTSAAAGSYMTPKAFSGKKWKRKNSILDKLK